MADFVQFTEGSNYIILNGWPSTVWFLLSVNPVGVLTESTTLAAVGEITGTGYIRQSQPLPTPVGGVLSFATMQWTNGIQVDWPNTVHSVVAATTINNNGVALCAWNLQPNGLPRNLSVPNTTEECTPTYVS